MSLRPERFKQTRAGYIPAITANTIRDLAFHTRYSQWVIIALAIEELDDKYQGNAELLAHRLKTWVPAE